MHRTYDELEGKLLARYGYQKDQAEKEITRFVERCKLKEKTTH